jgi:hypothetical protein
MEISMLDAPAQVAGHSGAWMKAELKQTGCHDRLHGWREKEWFRKAEPELKALNSEMSGLETSDSLNSRRLSLLSQHQ